MIKDYLKSIDKEKIRKIIYGTIPILFTISLFLNIFINMSILVLFIWVLFTVSVLVFDFYFFIKYIVYLFEYTTNIFGVFIIENSKIFLWELGRNSANHNSLWLITFVHWLFIAFLIFFDAREKNKNSIDSKLRFKNIDIKKYINYFLIIFYYFVIYSTLLLALLNPIYSLKIDRFVYRNEIMSPVWRFMDSLLIIFIPIIPMFLLKRKKIMAFFLLVPYLLYLFLTGNKFGGFLTVFMFMIPVVVKYFGLYHFNIKKIKSLAIILSIAIVFLISTLFIFNNLTYGGGISGFNNFIFNRAAQQGQLWWATYDLEKDQPMHLLEFKDEILSFFEYDQEIIDSKNFGIYKIMKLVTPAEIYNTKIAQYSRYAFSTDATIYYYFKVPGLIVFSILGSFILSKIVNWYWRVINTNDALNSIIAGNFYNIILSVLVQSDFNYLFSKRNLFLLIVYFIWNFNFKKESLNAKCE